MQVPLILQTYTIGPASYTLFQPIEAELKTLYQQRFQQNPATPFPYWGRVWPSAKALASYLQQNSGIIRKKQVLEIAAGLGLPSLVAAPLSSSILCTDYDTEAVAAMQQTINHHGFTHAKSKLFNWQNPQQYPQAEVLLLSDVNYEPGQFEALYKLINHYYNAETTIILCSPQRIMAKAFIENIEWMVRESINIDACKILVMRRV